jgi:hypothetical protein
LVTDFRVLRGSSTAPCGRYHAQAGLRPERGGDLILFLDFDGVLHPDPCSNPARLFERAPLLAETLTEFPEVCIVLSTSWRTSRTIDELVAPLPPLLRPRVIGVTPLFSEFDAPTHLMPYSRHAECVRWLLENRQYDRDWLALDDRPYWFAPYCELLVQCDPFIGFTEQVAARLRTALLRQRARLLQQIDALL